MAVLWDDTTTFRVSLTYASLSSTTQAGVLNGDNWFMIGDELMGVTTCTLADADTNTWVLSGLLRGMHGTEWAIDGHVDGERVVKLERGVTTVDVQQPLADIAVPYYYKIASAGQNLDLVPSFIFTNYDIRLKPVAPTVITGTRDGSGNLTIDWIRRNRVDDDWHDAAESPLDESSERWQIDFLDASATVIKKTVINIVTSSYLYTAANQITDYGAVQSSINVQIYQISTRVGRGYPGSETL